MAAWVALILAEARLSHLERFAYAIIRSIICPFRSRRSKGRATKLNAATIISGGKLRCILDRGVIPRFTSFHHRCPPCKMNDLQQARGGNATRRHSSGWILYFRWLTVTLHVPSREIITTPMDVNRITLNWFILLTRDSFVSFFFVID